MRPAVRPPGIDAYRAYMEGLEHFVQGQWRSALDHFHDALGLAPEYALPRIVSAIALWNLGNVREAADTAQAANRIRQQLGAFERAVLDMVLAWLSGDWIGAYRAASAQARMAPRSIAHFQVAEEARRLNRPRETRDLLARLNVDEGEMRGWVYYWVELSAAHHLLGEHTRALEAASSCRSLHPNDPTAALLEIRALAALGRDRDVFRVAEQSRASPVTAAADPGQLALEGALGLRSAGSLHAAEALLQRALDWSKDEGARNEQHERQAARILYHAGALDEARQLFEHLVTKSGGRVQPIRSHHPQLQAHLDEGFLAVIAAKCGDAAATARWCGRLEELDGPFLYGAQWYWLACAAAVTGDADRAARMLGRAFADGLPMEMFILTDPHIALVRGHERVENILKPRG